MMDFLPVHFIRPEWLLALPLCVALPWLWRHLRRPSGDWARVCDPHLLRWLSVGDAAQGRKGLGAWLAGLVILIATLALAGPSWQQLPDVSFSAQDSRVIVLDLSQSMLAEDLKPDRLTRARYRLSDLLMESLEGQVGMVTFAGDAYVVSPLTNDMNTIANMLPALRPDVVPVAGSRADRGLELAAELLRRNGTPGGEILLVSDDADERDAALAASLAAEGMVVSVLAVGTQAGAPIPSGNGFITDASGAVVIARTGFAGLEAVARAGGGRMSVLDGSSSPASPWLSGEGTDFALRDEGGGDRWADSGPWLLLLLLPLVAVGFRRGLLFSLALMLMPAMLLPAPAHAGLWDDLWQRKDQQAQRALQDDAPAEAAALAQDPSIAGEAWYRAGDYQRAAGSWSAVDDANDWYNRGNALALAGELDAAINAYDQALQRYPEMEDALYNKAIVEQLKDQQEQESEDQEGEGEQPEGESQDSEQEGQQDDSESEGGEEGQESEPQESEQGEGQEGEQQEQELAQAWSEEDAQAMEQWLRRIPDDPGGLLRRKFRNEHQRRGAPPDEKKTW
jgi:Ca-activated chloride channel family protein